MGRIPNGVYTAEFRSEAVKLVVQEGLSVDQAAKRLSVPKSSILLFYNLTEETYLETYMTGNVFHQ